MAKIKVQKRKQTTNQRKLAVGSEFPVTINRDENRSFLPIAHYRGKDGNYAEIAAEDINIRIFAHLPDNNPHKSYQVRGMFDISTEYGKREYDSFIDKIAQENAKHG